MEILRCHPQIAVVAGLWDVWRLSNFTDSGPKGVITARKKGKAVITVTSGKKELGRCTVKVVAAPKRVIVTPDATSIEIGQTLQLEPKLPKNTHSSLTYTSSNRKVAKVSASGLVTAVSAGKATVTVKTHNGK